MKTFFEKFLVFFILMITIVSLSYSQTNQLTLGGTTYVFENNKWYVIDSKTEYRYEINTHLITVKLRDGITVQSLMQVISNSGITFRNQNGLGFIRLNIPESLSFNSAYELIDAVDLCSQIEINTYGIDLTRHPNDPWYPWQYYLNQASDWDINAPEAWWWETGSNNVIVAVIDHGVHKYHPDLTNNMSPLSWDFIGEDSDPTSDLSTHGTAVTGVFGATTNNDDIEGIAGIAGGWGSIEPACKIMGLRTELEDNYIVDAIYYAANNGAKVINMSFTTVESIAMTTAIEYAYRIKGCLLVAAAGNAMEDIPGVLFPANHPDVMAVGGTLNDSRHWGSYGEELEITAPAYSIFTTQAVGTNYGYDWWTGTSFSCPMVCGGAALVWSYTPSLIHMDVRSLLKQSAFRNFAGYDELYYGKGLLRLDQALASLIEPGYLIPVPPTNTTLTGSVGQHPTISWTKVTGVHHYNVYRSVDLQGAFYFQKVAEVVHNPNLNTHSWFDNSVIIQNKRDATSWHYYRITAVDSYNYESITSNQVSTASNWAEKMAIESFNSPINYELSNAYPNPFNPGTNINYSIKEAGLVKLEIFNILGEKVSMLVNEMQEAGYYSKVFNASFLPSGIYFYRLQTDNFSESKKMILNK